MTVVTNRSDFNILPNSCLQVVIMRLLYLLNRHTLSFCLDDVQGAGFVCDESDISSQTFIIKHPLHMPAYAIYACLSKPYVILKVD